METPSKKGYIAGVKPEVKVFAAELALALQRRGVARALFVESAQDTSYPVTKASLDRHIAALEKGDTPLSTDKKSGQKPLLSVEEWDIVAGAVLCAEEKTHLQWVVDWIQEKFGLEVALNTVSKHLSEMKLTIKLVRKRPMPKGMTREQYVRLYYEDVLRLHNSGFFKHSDDLIYTIDATSNSRRLERETTIGMSGAPAPKFSSAKVLYTDTYLAALWKDGTNRTPTLMFTFNPALEEGGPRWEEVKEWCRAWGLETCQIVFAKSTKKYCATTQKHIGHFKALYCNRLAGTHVMHDDGNEFKIDGESILGDGASMEFVFTPATHGEESVLDNNWFAIAKNWWRAEREKFCGKDFDKQSVYLLYCIDFYKSDQISRLYMRNFLLDQKKLSLAHVDDLLKQTTRMTFQNQERMERYIGAFQKRRKENDENAPQDVLEALESGLDGSYWQ